MNSKNSSQSDSSSTSGIQPYSHEPTFPKAPVTYDEGQHDLEDEAYDQVHLWKNWQVN